MAWQKGITHIFTWTNIIIPTHKHINISVFSPGSNTAPDRCYKKMTYSGCAKITCHGYYWSLHLQQQSPKVFFFFLFIGRQEGREGGKARKEWKKIRRKRKKTERRGRLFKQEGHTVPSFPSGRQPDPRRSALRQQCACLGIVMPIP